MTISEALIQAKEQGKSAVLEKQCRLTPADFAFHGMYYVRYDEATKSYIPCDWSERILGFSELTSNDWRVE